MKKNLLIFSLFPLLFFASSGHAYSETVKLSQDGGMEIEIVHPDSVLNEKSCLCRKVRKVMFILLTVTTPERSGGVR